MVEKLKELILDYQELRLETGVPRRLESATVSGKATVYIGVRRSGKSTYMFQQIAKLELTGVSRTNILYLNFFDDRLHSLRYQDPGIILEAYYSLYPEKKDHEKVYFFFDEVQMLQNWEPFVDRILRTENSEVYLTGSSARMLSKEIASQMRGRSLTWEIFPFSFREYLDANSIDSTLPLSTSKRFVVEKHFDNYWESGGFPEVIKLDSRLRTMVHQEYFNSILFRDLIERHGISHPRVVTDLAHRLINNHVGSLYSINKLTDYLKSLGHKTHKTIVGDILEWFEDAYFFFSVRKYDASVSRSNANPKKAYCIDNALVNSISSGILVDSGHLLENMVFLAIRRITSEIYYYRSKRGHETDFVYLPSQREKHVIQVCESLVDPKTKKRELSGTFEAMNELGLSTGTIVTRNENEQIETSAGTINVIPIWRFLLQIDCNPA